MFYNRVKNFCFGLVRQHFPNLYKSKFIKRTIPSIRWKLEGKPVPPPHCVKQMAIEKYKTKYSIKTLVETGTYLGDMVDAQKNNFEHIFSVELGSDLAFQAAERFKHLEHIRIIQGDSGQVLRNLVPNLKEPALFWLDGHYSAGITARGDKDTPILEELDTILSQKLSHVILIDDARCFTGSSDYPSVEYLIQFVKRKNPSLSIVVKDDIIRIMH